MGKASRKKKAVDKTAGASGAPSDEAKNLSLENASFGLLIIVFLISFIVYSNALSNGFVWDDGQQVLENPWITSMKHIPEIFSKGVWGFSGTKSNYYRPFMHLSYMFAYYLFGFKPWGFHLINILFHAGTSVLVFLLISKLMKKSERRLREPPLLLWERLTIFPAFIAAILFATHPIHTEAVVWVASVPELSYSFFFLLSFYLYMKSEDGMKASRVLSLFFFAVSTLSKEPAVMLPFILMAYDYIFQNKSYSTFRTYKTYIPYFIIAGIYLAVRYHAIGGLAPKKLNVALGTYGYIINTFPLFTGYLRDLLLPVNLNAFHVFHPMSSIMEPKGILSLILTIAFVAVTFVALKKRSKFFFGLLMVALPLLPALYIPAIGGGRNIFAERYLYLPSFGFVLMIAWSFLWVKNVKPQLSFGLVLFLSIVSVFYSVGTLSRNTVWKDEVTVYSDTIKKSPDASETRYNLGVVYARQNRLSEAINEYKAALEVDPDDAEARNNLAAAYLKQNRLPDAINEYMAAIKSKPDFPEAHYNLGVIYSDQNRFNEAEHELITAVKLNPDYPEAHNNLGIIYGMQNRVDKAINEFTTALELKHDFSEAHNNLGYIYLMQNRLQEAAKHFKMALEINPGFSQARQNLNLCYEKMKTMK